MNQTAMSLGLEIVPNTVVNTPLHTFEFALWPTSNQNQPCLLNVNYPS